MLHTMKLTVKSISYHDYLHDEELCVSVCWAGVEGEGWVLELQCLQSSYIARVSSRNFGLGGRGVAILRTMFLPPLPGVFIFVAMVLHGGDSKQAYPPPPQPSFSVSLSLSGPLFPFFPPFPPPPPPFSSFFFGGKLGALEGKLPPQPSFSVSLSLSFPSFPLSSPFLLSFFGGSWVLWRGSSPPPPHWMKLCIHAWHCTTLLHGRCMVQVCHV